MPISINEPLCAAVEMSPWSLSARLYLWNATQRFINCQVTSEEFPTDETAIASEPFLQTTHAEMQTIFEAMWTAGMRPSNLAPADQVVEAQKENLTDMRTTATAQQAIIEQLIGVMAKDPPIYGEES